MVYIMDRRLSAREDPAMEDLKAPREEVDKPPPTDPIMSESLTDEETDDERRLPDSSDFRSSSEDSELPDRGDSSVKLLEGVFKLASDMAVTLFCKFLGTSGCFNLYRKLELAEKSEAHLKLVEPKLSISVVRACVH